MASLCSIAIGKEFVMQTFLPYPSFKESAKVLDRARLGKQRVEAKQILLALANGGGWSHHPATKMWRGYEFALAKYGEAICKEWIGRGYKDSLLPFFQSPRPDFFDWLKPPWIGNEEFHASHRSNLLRKMPEHYGQFGWKEPDDLPYVWPTV